MRDVQVKTTIGTTVLGVGSTAIVAGLTILALPRVSVNEAYGFGLIGGGGVLDLLALLLLFSMRNRGEGEREMAKKKTGKGDNHDDDRVTISGANPVVSIRQSGGQTARNIINVGLQPRTLANTDTAPLREAAAALSGHKVRVTATMNDPESIGFAAEITAVLRDAGVEVSEGAAMWVRGLRGISVSHPPLDYTVEGTAILRSLRDMGFDARGSVNPDLRWIEIKVGAL